MAEGETVLNYEPERITRRRKWRRRGLLLLLILFASSGFVWRKQLKAFADNRKAVFLLYEAERLCRNFSAPSDQLVYSNHYEDSKALPQPGNGIYTLNPDPFSEYLGPRADDTFWLAHAATQFMARSASRAVSADPTAHLFDPTWHSPPILFSNVEGAARATAFLHELTSPSGHRRLVLIGCFGDWHGPTFDAHVWQPGTPLTPCQFINVEANVNLTQRIHLRTALDDKSSRIFAGQVDPNDASRFSIAVEGSDGPYVVTGRLMDDDQVEFSVDKGWRLEKPGQWLLNDRECKLIDATHMPTKVKATGNEKWNEPYMMALSDDAKIATIVTEYDASRIDLKTGDRISRIKLSTAERKINLSPDGQLILLLAWRGNSTIWKWTDSASGRTILEDDDSPPVWHFTPIQSTISQDGKYAALTIPTGDTSKLKRWKLPSCEPMPLLALDGDPDDLAWMPNGDLWLLQKVNPQTPGATSLWIHVLDGEGKKTREFELLKNVERSTAYRISITPDAGRLLLWSNRNIRCFDTASDQFLFSSGMPDFNVVTFPGRTVSSVDFAALSGHDVPEVLAVWPMNGQRTVYKLGVAENGVRARQFTPDMRWLITCGANPELEFWPVPEAIRTAATTQPAH